MKDKIKLEVEKIDRILKEENPYNDWIKGRHSALRGVKIALEKILNEETVEMNEICVNCNNQMTFIGKAFECHCGVVKLVKQIE